MKRGCAGAEGDGVAAADSCGQLALEAIDLRTEGAIQLEANASAISACSCSPMWGAERWM